MFAGTLTALITPMKAGGEVDSAKLRDLVEWQIDQGIHGLVACGTTAETATLTVAEQATVMRTVVEQTKGRVPVIGGAGTNATASAIARSKLAEEAGVDALLHVTPYYNKPTQAGLIAHYQAIAAAVRRPIVLYNVPGRTGCDLLPETIATLAEIPNVVAVKDAVGSIARIQRIVTACPPTFAVLSGDDDTAMAAVAVGAQGVISVTSNVVPHAMSTMIAAAREGDLGRARTLLYQHLSLIRLLFIEPNPIPVKAAVFLLGLCENVVRLPLLPLDGEAFEKLKMEMMILRLKK